jgi:catalase
MADGRAVEFVQQQFRHCKALLVLGDGITLLEAAGIPLEDEDDALVRDDGQGLEAALAAFTAAVARHRFWERETEPPVV